MADNQGFFKPWKDGKFENTVKVCGGILIFLFISGLLGADYPKIASNPYVWGLYIRGAALNITGRN
jgi:hypothetical protein